MLRACWLWGGAPEGAGCERDVEWCRRVRGGTSRHGGVFGAPMGEPPYRYYAEWEWPDLDAFKSAARSEEFMETGKDAMEIGGKFTVMFYEVDSANPSPPVVVGGARLHDDTLRKGSTTHDDQPN